MNEESEAARMRGTEPSDCSTEAQFEYKCRRCGALYRNPCCSTDLAPWILIEATMSRFGGDATKGGRVCAHAMHWCKDGGRGVADLLGYRVVDTLSAENESSE